MTYLQIWVNFIHFSKNEVNKQVNFQNQVITVQWCVPTVPAARGKSRKMAWIQEPVTNKITYKVPSQKWQWYKLGVVVHAYNPSIREIEAAIIREKKIREKTLGMVDPAAHL